MQPLGFTSGAPALARTQSPGWGATGTGLGPAEAALLHRLQPPWQDESPQQPLAGPQVGWEAPGEPLPRGNHSPGSTGPPAAAAAPAGALGGPAGGQAQPAAAVAVVAAAGLRRADFGSGVITNLKSNRPFQLETDVERRQQQQESIRVSEHACSQHVYSSMQHARLRHAAKAKAAGLRYLCCASAPVAGGTTAAD